MKNLIFLAFIAGAIALLQGGPESGPVPYEAPQAAGMGRLRTAGAMKAPA